MQDPTRIVVEYSSSQGEYCLWHRQQGVPAKPSTSRVRTEGPGKGSIVRGLKDDEAKAAWKYHAKVVNLAGLVSRVQIKHPLQRHHSKGRG